MSADHIHIREGFAPGQRDQAAALYWEAFGDKLGRVLGPRPRALAYLTRVMQSDHCFTACTREGALLGIAGFRSPYGSLAGGAPADMRAIYGRFGALWRQGLLWLLSHDVDNQRFLVDGISVTEAARGQGIGTLLLEALCAEGARRGYGLIRLEVVAENPRARALYARQGFVPTHEERIGLLRHVFRFAAVTTMVRVLERPQ